jgi:hypothetical protein
MTAVQEQHAQLMRLRRNISRLDMASKRERGKGSSTLSTTDESAKNIGLKELIQVRLNRLHPPKPKPRESYSFEVLGNQRYGKIIRTIHFLPLLTADVEKGHLRFPSSTLHPSLQSAR